MYYHRTKLCDIHLRSVTQLQKRVTSFTHLERWKPKVRRWEADILFGIQYVIDNLQLCIFKIQNI